MSAAQSELFKNIPAIGVLLDSASGSALRDEFGPGLAAFALRSAVGSIRLQIRERTLTQVPAADAIVASARAEIERLRSPQSNRAVNATGVVLHTGLGRAPMCDEAIQSMATFAGYSLLEVEVESGARGKRETQVERLLMELTGCEAALVVNNNAAATFLILKALCAGREVVVSRGELVEIGGSFRMPDVMMQSGAVLREVGTTNRTYARDYEAVIGEKTGALMHVHQSNYRIEGFTAAPVITELCELGRKHGVLVIDDVGSGAMVPLDPYGIPGKPLVRDSVQAGCDIVCFSGDKLLSGPQCGVIIGRKVVVEKVRHDPFFRMMRPDKMLLAALEATLIHYLDGATGAARLPVYQILGKTTDALEASAKRILSGVKLPKNVSAVVVPSEAFIGGGSVPGLGVPSRAIKLSRKNGEPGKWAETFAAQLRLSSPSVFSRLNDGEIFLDLRCLVGDDEQSLITALQRSLKETP